MNSETEVILITSYATMETTVQALRMGVFDYIQKPFELEQLKHRDRNALKMRRIHGNFAFYQKEEAGNHLDLI